MAANTAIVSWNANSEADLAGYKVYYGDRIGIYSGFVNVPAPFTEVTLQSQFTHDGRWYFAVTAYDTSNNESGFSVEVSKRIIRVPSFLKRRH